MKQLAILALALTPFAGLAADLHISAGKAYVVGLDQQELILERLHIGNNVNISFAPGVDSWRVHAKHASIGNDVVVDGRGIIGQVGGNGLSGASCEESLDGAAGDDGVAGSDAVEIRFQLGLESLGSLQILSAGGDGGLGGNGGDGADLESDCSAQVAGEGGNGGNGGEGGRGGDVTFLYQSLSKTESGDAMAARINVNTEGGSGGSGGYAGSGGTGSGGYYIKKKTLAGNRKWISGDQGGLAGSPGESGSAGKPGRILIDQLIFAAGQAKPVIDQSGMNTLKSLQNQIRLLSKRVEALEAAQDSPR